MEQRTCPCGKVFETAHPTRRYHDKRCKKRYENAKARGTLPRIGEIGAPYDCARCDARCIPGENVAPHATRFCGYDCKAAWHRRDPEGRRRRALAALERASEGETGSRWVEGACARSQCEERFVRRASNNAVGYCSRRRMRKALRPEHRRRRRAKYGSDLHRHRARRFGVAYETINVRKVFERDGYRCGICRESTKRDARVPDPKAPTLDHIVPMSKGGPHLYSNVQCACFECNWRKADGAADDQLRLVG